MKNKKIYRDIKKHIIGTREFNYLKSGNKMYYPIDFEFALRDEEFYYTPKDENGVPIRKIDSRGITTYNPTRVASYTLGHWNRYKKNDKKEDLDKFNIGLNWFVTFQKSGIWYYNFDNGTLKAPWISGLAQGQAISVLSRAYKLTNVSLYKQISLEAFKPFEIKIEEGGVLSNLKEDIFFEEYPEKNPIHVLNGYLSAIIGILDLLSILEESDTDFQRVNNLLLKAIKSLENNIERWDNKYWSTYDLSSEKKIIQNTCTISYHSLHIAQLKYIGNEFNNNKIILISEEWEKYANSYYNRIKSLLVKIIYRLQNPIKR